MRLEKLSFTKSTDPAFQAALSRANYQASSYSTLVKEILFSWYLSQESQNEIKNNASKLLMRFQLLFSASHSTVVLNQSEIALEDDLVSKYFV